MSDSQTNTEAESPPPVAPKAEMPLPVVSSVEKPLPPLEVEGTPTVPPTPSPSPQESGIPAGEMPPGPRVTSETLQNPVPSQEPTPKKSILKTILTLPLKLIPFLNKR